MEKFFNKTKLSVVICLTMLISIIFCGCSNGSNNTHKEVITEQTPNYTLTITSSNTNYGNVYGGGTYAENERITIYAVANDGYNFNSWSDGGTNPIRTITMIADTSLTATFTEKTKYITLKEFDMYVDTYSSAASDLALYYQEIRIKKDTNKYFGTSSGYGLGYTNQLTLYKDGHNYFDQDGPIYYEGGYDSTDQYVYGQNSVEFIIDYTVFENGDGQGYRYTSRTVQFNLAKNNLTPTVTIVSGNGWAIRAKLIFAEIS